MAFATPHMLLNWCRAYNSNLPVCFRMDSAFKFNLYQMCINFMGFGYLGGYFNIWIYSMASTENQAGYDNMFSAGKSAVRMLLKNVFPCSKPCEFCDLQKNIKARPKYGCDCGLLLLLRNSPIPKSKQPLSQNITIQHLLL